MTRTLCVLAVIGVTSMIGYSEKTAGGYVSPSEAVPTGKAPKTQIQLLNQENLRSDVRSSSTRETRRFPDCWSLQRSIKLRVLISLLSEH